LLRAGELLAAGLAALLSKLGTAIGGWLDVALNGAGACPKAEEVRLNPKATPADQEFVILFHNRTRDFAKFAAEVFMNSLSLNTSIRRFSKPLLATNNCLYASAS